MEIEKTIRKGRGTFSVPQNRFEDHRFEKDPDLVDDWEEVSPKTTFTEDHSKSILSKNNSPDLGFDYSINPYRGCEHGCIYCYARPTHEYLGNNCGIDFETKIYYKPHAPELLATTFNSKTWAPEYVMFSGNTDCYQPIERKFQLTRKCLEIFAAFRNPVGVITKNALVTRDIDILQELAKYNAVSVVLSITTLDDKLLMKLEPRTSRPWKKLEAIATLQDAGIPVGVNVAPIIPGITDHEVFPILKAAREAGASFAGYTLLRLPFGVAPLFEKWIEEHYPDRKNKILTKVLEMREGRLNDPDFGSRMKGKGEYATFIRSQFQLHTRRLGYGNFPRASTEYFTRRPDLQPKKETPQMELF